MIGKYLIIT